MSDRSGRLAEEIRKLAQLDEPLPHSVFYVAQVVSQNVDKRVSVRLIDRDGLLPDPAGESRPVSVWCGVPGVSAELPQGAGVALGFFRADATQAFCSFFTPYGKPGHIPTNVAHEATTSIRFGGESDCNVYVGSDGVTVPVALAPAIPEYVTALHDIMAQLIGALAVVPPLTQPPFLTQPQAVTLLTALSNAYSTLAANIESERLEAQ